MVEPAPGAVPAGDYMHEYQSPRALDAGRAALVVVDMQEATGSRTAGLGRLRQASVKGSYLDYRFTRIETVVLPAIRRLLAGFRAHGRPVIYLVLGSASADYEDMPPHLGAFTRWVGNRVDSPVHRILDGVRPQPGEPVLCKTTVGGFASTEIEAVLHRLRVADVVFCGISTSYCVDQTAREAADRGFRALVVEDAVAENEEDWHRHSLRLFARAFGRVADSAAVLAELAEAPGGHHHMSQSAWAPE